MGDNADGSKKAYKKPAMKEVDQTSSPAFGQSLYDNYYGTNPNAVSGDNKNPYENIPGIEQFILC